MIKKEHKKRVNDYNIIMIIIDGARFDRLKNFKNFQKWANKGTLFSKMITYGTQTITSLHAIFSGLYGNINGADNYFGILKFKKKSCKTIPQYLKGINFYTWGDTLNDIIISNQGFDKLDIHDEKKDNLTLRHQNLIKRCTGLLKKKERKFFLYLHYSNIHTEMIKSVFKKYKDFDKEYFENKKENLENYDSYIQKADEYLGDLLKVCNQLDLFNNTIFIILSDHGASTGEKIGEIGYGRYCYDYTIKSFAIFIQPNIFPVKEVSKLCRTIDILPTILDIFDITEDDNFKKIQGKSLIPFIYNEPDERIAFSESAGLVDPYPSEEKPFLKCVRTKDWKLIYNIKTRERELYNLQEDPEENKDISKDNEEMSNKLFEKLVALSPEVEK